MYYLRSYTMLKLDVLWMNYHGIKGSTLVLGTTLRKRRVWTDVVTHQAQRVGGGIDSLGWEQRHSKTL